MTPASNSEARKRSEVPRPADDPVAGLRALAAEILHEDLTDSDVMAWRERVADRLDRLADEVVARPPLLSEIINHAGMGGTIEVHRVRTGGWAPVAMESCDMHAWLATYGDHPCHGYRLATTPEPTTERVRLDQVIGRRLPGFPRETISDITGQFPDGWMWRDPLGSWRSFDVADDGTVEVMVEDES